MLMMTMMMTLMMTLMSLTAGMGELGTDANSQFLQGVAKSFNKNSDKVGFDFWFGGNTLVRDRQESQAN